MKIARIVVSLALLAVVAGAAHAQGGCYTLSWNSCTPQVADQAFTGPAIYKLVLSATSVDKPNVGHDSNIVIGPNVPDAWRFDDAGCQTGSQMALSNNAFNKACPSMKGTNSLTITNFGYDPGSKIAALRLAITYDNLLTIVPATRYTLWVMSFDHTYSVAGAGTPGVDCGNADQGLAFNVEFCQMLQVDGFANFIQACPGNAPCTWAGGPQVPTVPASWGRVKGLYR